MGLIIPVMGHWALIRSESDDLASPEVMQNNKVVVHGDYEKCSNFARWMAATDVANGFEILEHEKDLYVLKKKVYNIITQKFKQYIYYGVYRVDQLDDRVHQKKLPETIAKDEDRNIPI